MDKEIKIARIVDDPVYSGYICYRCPICNELILRRKIGEVLKKDEIYCSHCGKNLRLK